MVQAAISSSVAFYTWSRELVIAWLEVSILSLSLPPSLSLFLPFPLSSSLPLPSPFPLVLFVFLPLCFVLFGPYMSSSMCLSHCVDYCVCVHCLGLGGCSLLVHIGSQEQYKVRRDDGGMSIYTCRCTHIQWHYWNLFIFLFLVINRGGVESDVRYYQ